MRSRCGHGRGTAGLCVCVCWNLGTTAVREVKHIRGWAAAFFFFFPQLKVSFHTAEAFCCGILQVTASGLICLSMKEMDTQRAPGERRVEERGTLHVERLGTTCVAFRPLYLIYRLSQDGFTPFRPLYSVVLSHLTLNSFTKFTYFYLWTILNFHSISSVFLKKKIK